MICRSRAIVLVLFFVNGIFGSFLQFRPLSASQVYNALRRAGREDAVPEGRFITHGLAAMSGFAAGIASGIGVPLVLNIDLANVTGILGNSNNNRRSSPVRVQEICFNSKSLDEVSDDEDTQNEATENGYMKRKRMRVREGRGIEDDPTTSSNDEDPETDNPQTETTSSADPDDDSSRLLPTFQTTNEIDGTNAETTNDVTSPAATDGQTNTNTGTTVDDGAGTGTNTETTTQTGTGGSVNCVVLQKPRK